MGPSTPSRREITVIEAARKAANLSQQQLANVGGRTTQSAISEYESGRKSPTLDVVVRLLRAAKAELTFRPVVEWFWDETPDGATFMVPDRLWSVPTPTCYARVRAFMFFHFADQEVWDLSKPKQRYQFYELLLCHGTDDMMVDVLDGALLVEAWPHLNLPDVIREAWQRLIDQARGVPDGCGRMRRDAPLDPGGINARISAEMGLPWPRPVTRARRPRTSETRPGD